MSKSGRQNLPRQILTLLTAISAVWHFSHALSYDSDLHQRTRRQSAPPQVFVVPKQLSGDLFNVSSWPPNLQEVYSFVDPAPDGLLISQRGMVSLRSESVLITSNITFGVNVTINGTSNRIIQVDMYIVNRGFDADIFANSPSPMWATCPVWIRPGTVIYQVKAIDTLYGAKVQYRLESGGEGKFDVDKDSGNVFIVGRWMFELKKIYTLAISAQIIGMAQSRTTPSQLLKVYVGALNPQFSVPVYNVSFYGNQSLVLTVQAESFQNLTLTYSMEVSDAGPINLFRLNSDTGDITLLSVLDYRTSSHQYNFRLTVTEAYTNLVTTTTLTLNLLPFNQPPVFLVSYYVKTDVPEDIPVSNTILSVMAYDYDPGAFGQLNYTLTDDNFVVNEISNSEAQIIVAKPLDYDKTEGHRYEFSVIATDGGNLSSAATVQVWMKNSNDEAPQFEPARQSVIVKEGAQAGLELMYIQAYDPDGDNITFSYINPISKFSVNSITGLLTLNEAILPGTSTTTPSFNLTVRVTDDGACCSGQGQGTPRSTVGYIEVVIYRVNTQPVFSQCRSYNAAIDENVAANTTVLMMIATDRDIGDNGRVIFSSFGSGNQDYFGVRTSVGSPMTAELYSGMRFDREIPPKDSLKFNDTIKIPVTVKVQDEGSPPLSTNCILLVTINDVNDNSPLFDYTDYRVTVMNNLQQNARVIRVFATDVDAGENARISYSFSNIAADDCRSNFAIDSNSGWISKTGSGVMTPTSAGIVCSVVATDNGSPKLSATVTVTINITSSANSVFPSWQNYPGTNSPIDDYDGLYVLENDTMSTSVNLIAVGPSGFVISYYLHNDPQLSFNDATFGYSVLSNGSFSVYMARAVDASQKWKYYLRCRAFTSNNPGGAASVARLLVNIKDINDKRPYFIGMDSNGFYPASISIHTLPGDWVVNVTAIDMDREWPNNKISYSFDDDCKDCSSPSEFTINPDTGEIKAQTTSFKPNTDSTYTLGVVALDGVDGMNRNRGWAKVSIRFLGSSYVSPKFNQNFTGTVPEGSIFGTTIVNATVPASPYDILPQYGITTGNNGHRFAVDFKTGRVYVVGDIDYLEQKDYILGYRVFDGTKIDTAVIVLTVSRSNFYPPVFNPAVYTSNGTYVEKDSGTVGSVIARVNATARDGSIVYSLVNPSESFAVDSTTGAVTIRKPLSRDQPDGYATWQVNVMATDSASNSNGYAVVSLVLKDLNDHPPVFDTCCLWGNVPEDSKADYTIFQLRSFDPDNGPNGTVKYTIPPGAPPSPFTISPDGVVRRNGSLNYSAQNNYTLTVTATDGGGSAVNRSINLFVLDANDNLPIFAQPKQYSVSIPEEMAIGSSVLTVQATDADVGAGAQLNYSVVTGQDSAFFYADSIIVASSGVIKINQRIDFDITRKSLYSFTVNVKDPDPNHVDQASVVVTVYDINDNAPVFSNSSMAISISESSAVNTVVAKFSATDIDSGDNATFNYFVDYHYTDPLFNFQVDPTSGEVKIRNKLDYEVTNYLAVHILAVDKGVPPLTGTATLTVYVLDANDRAPVLRLIDGDSRPFVPADATRGTRILHLKAEDPDNSTNPTISFSYDSTCPHCGDFKIIQDTSTPNAAWIVADRDGGYKRSDLQFSSYNLSITLSDGTNSATYPINLIVESKDDNPSSDGEKTVTVYNYARSSGAFSDLPLGNVYVTDPDDWDVKNKKFALVSQTGSYFSLRDGGQLVMYGNASEGQYTAVVDVTDVNRPDVVAKGKVTANVKFVNDTAVQSAGTIRLSGIDATDLLAKDGGVLKLQKLQQKIAELLNTKPEYVDIFSFSNVPGLNKMVDVVYSAHGSPYYTPEKMNALVWTNRNKIYQDIQLNVTMAPVDLCQAEFQNCWDSGCTTYMNIGPDPGLVNTNQTSFVGLNTSFVQKCICPSSSNLLAPAVATCEAYPCYNSGTCVVNGTNIICICPVGFDGPRCQKTKISFSGGQSYLYLKPLEICERSRLSLDFQTTASDGLLLFNGPMTGADSPTFVDFIAIQIRNGQLELRINLGDGNLLLPTTNNVFLPVNDGQWHTVEVFHEGLSIRMVQDYCSKAPYDETLQSYSMNRSQCEVSGFVPREKFLLNVVTPLQLGGRSDVSFNGDLIKMSFSGCVRNLQHNGELYDLAYSPIQTWSGVSECNRDQCPSSCPANASCVTDFSGTSLCLCPPGFGGDQCASPAAVKSFGSGGFANWTFSPTFSSKFNATSALDASLQAMFRTRQSNGIILLGESFSTLERNILEVVNGNLQFRYDLGNGDWNLSLPYVRVDDGVWHTARVVRHGNQVILRLDGGDDIYFNSTFPRDARRVLRISNLYGLGEVRMNPWSLAVSVKGNLVPSCLQDVRFMDQSLPLEGSNTIASVTLSKATNDCPSYACANVRCGEGKICYDLWNYYECRCQDNITVWNPSQGNCLPPVACFAGLCGNGGTCFVIGGVVGCICPPQWGGTYCYAATPTEEPIGGASINRTAAIVVPIILGFILLLLLILLLVWCIGRNRKPDYLLDYPDEDASRENVIAYDEEGAGEEDVQAYDLMRLQKPLDPDLDGIHRPYLSTGLKSAAPDPLSRRHRPGDYPNVGEFINGRLKDADDDDADQDSQRGYDYEGGNSQAGSLSTLGSSSSGDLDFGYLNDWGPPFKKLADLYGDEDDEDNELQDVSHV